MRQFARPPFISEREVAHKSPTGKQDDAEPEDCVWDSGLMQYLGSNPGKAEASHAEAEQLRAVAKPNDPLGPSNTEDLLKAFKARYSFVPNALPAGSASIVAALVPGTIATVSGRLSNFPPKHPLRRTSPNFEGGHRICVYRTDTVIHWLDPMGRVSEGYDGVDVTMDDVKTFANGFDRHTISQLATKEPDVQFVNLNEFKAKSGRTLKIPTGTKVFKLDGTELLSTTQELTVPVFGIADAMAGQWVVEIGTKKVYKDDKERPTLVMVKLPNAIPVDVNN